MGTHPLRLHGGVVIALRIARAVSIGLAAVCLVTGALALLAGLWAISIPPLLIALGLTWMLQK